MTDIEIREKFFYNINLCNEIFKKKNDNYGNSFDHFRIEGLTDQILIKIRRVIKLQESEINKVNESIEETVTSIINYCIINLYKIDGNSIQFLNFYKGDNINIKNYYIYITNICFDILEKKNHDYDNSWQIIRNKTIIDLIHVKIHRIINMENNGILNKKETNNIEESLKNLQEYENYIENFIDIINFSILYLIKNS